MAQIAQAGVIFLIIALTAIPAVAQTRDQGIELLTEAENLHTSAKTNDELQRAADKCDQALQILQKSGFDEGVAVLNQEIGDVRRRLEKCDTAWEYYEKALAVARELKDRRLEANILDDLGMIHTTWGKHDKAVNYLLHALDIKRQLNERAGEAKTLNHLAFAFEGGGKYHEAVEYGERALAVHTDLNDRKGRADALNALGNVYCKMGKYGQGAEYAETALEIARELNYGDAEATSLYILGMVYTYWGEYDTAKEYYERALALARQLRTPDAERKALGGLGSLYQAWGEYDKAKEYYEKALTIAEQLKGPAGEIWALSILGGLYQNWGEYDKAKEYYEKALAIAKEAGGPAGERWALSRLGSLYQDRGEYDKAKAYYEQALALARQLRTPDAEARALGGLGSIYEGWGKYDKAKEYYEEALAIARELKNPVGQRWALSRIGNVYLARGQYDRALECHQASLDMAVKLRNPRGEAAGRHNLGEVFANSGQYDKALECYEQALEIKKRLKIPLSRAVTLNMLGVLFREWGQHKKAEENYRESMQIARERKLPMLEAEALTSIAEVLVDRREVLKQTQKRLRQFYAEKAQEKLEAALGILQKIGAPSIYPKKLLGNLYLDLGQTEKAEPLLIAAEDWAGLGRLHLLKAEHGQARKYYERVLEATEKSKKTNDLFAAYTGLGKVFDALQDDINAEACYQNAVNVTEVMRDSVPIGQRANFFQVKVEGFSRREPYQGLIRIYNKIYRPDKSLRMSELIRGRVFAEQIAHLYKEKKEEELRNRIAALKRDRDGMEKPLTNLGVKVDKKPAPEKYENISKEIKQVESELNKLKKELRVKDKKYAAIKYPRPGTLADSALHEEEYVIYYDLSPESVSVKLIKGKKIVRTFSLDNAALGCPEKSASDCLEEKIRKFRHALENGYGKLGEFDPKLAAFLYDTLLSRVLSDVPRGSPLVIIPDGILATVPFEALVVSGATENTRWNKDPRGDPYPEGITYVGDLHTVSYYQSIYALTLERTLAPNAKGGGKTLVLADPVFNQEDPWDALSCSDTLPRRETVSQAAAGQLHVQQIGGVWYRLPDTCMLATSLKGLNGDATDVLIGMAAKKHIFFEKPLANYANIVLATHGSFGQGIREGRNKPEIKEPVILTTLWDASEKPDGLLRMTEVAGLKLNANIVALTACLTGLGEEIAGEGVMSMGRAFQAAGAKSVLMSLWEVDLLNAVDLVESIFRHLQAGKSKAEALRLARQEIRARGFDHPFFWAAFILVGETN